MTEMGMSSHADTIRRLHLLDADRGWEGAACVDALVTLEALLAENQRLRDALERISTAPDKRTAMIEVAEIARIALDGTPSAAQ